MNSNELGIIEVDETPPALDLTTEEVEALADELIDYHAEFAGLYYRVEQAHWGYKYLQGLMSPIERKAIQPIAMALEGGNIQAMQQFIGRVHPPVLTQRYMSTRRISLVLDADRASAVTKRRQDLYQ